MGYNNPDVYYQPEAFGLTPLGQLDDPDADWSFDIFSVWKHESGKIYYGEDAGCSCPSPFEDATSLDHLTEVVSMFDFIDAVTDYFNSIAPWDDGYNSRLNWESPDLDHKWKSFKADCLELIQTVRDA